MVSAAGKGSPPTAFSTDDAAATGTSAEESYEEATDRRLVWRIAREIRIDRRVAEGASRACRFTTSARLSHW